MAVAASWDCLLAPINHCWSPHSFGSTNSKCKTLLLPHYVAPCKIRSWQVSSLRFPSAVIERQEYLEPPGTDSELKIQFSAPEVDDLNEFLRGLLRDPKSQELGCWYYEKAKENPDFTPDESTLDLLIMYFVTSERWDLIFLLCEDMKGYGVLPGGYTCSKVISGCIRSRKFRLVKALLEVLGSDRSVASSALESAMGGYNELHMFRSTVALFERMKSSGIRPNLRCYCWMMEACQKLGRIDEVLALFHAYQSYGNFPQHSARMYRILCASLANSGRGFEALEYFRDMTNTGIPGDPSFYSSLICSFARAQEIEVAEKLFREAEEKGMLKDPEMFLRVVLMYVEKGLVEKTIHVVEMMRKAKVKVSDCILCAVVNGFSKLKGYGSAVRVYEELVELGHDPGQVTYASIINAYCRLGLYSKAKITFAEMEHKGFDKCLVAYSNMVAMYGKTRRIGDAMKLVAKMKQKGCEPNIWVYNSLIDMHGRAKNLKKVEKTWKEMKRKKVAPDKVSYTSLISAYNKAEEFERCVQFYQEFRANGGDIDKAMAGTMVGVFSKTGRIDELVKLLRDMKAEGTDLDGRLYHSARNALRDAGLQTQIKWLQGNFYTSQLSSSAQGTAKQHHFRA